MLRANQFQLSGRRKTVGKRGFTLTEVLVVIAIMIVLAALLFPAFARGKEQAKFKECQSRLHQLSAAFNLYRIDNDGLGYVWASYDGKGYTYPYNSFEPMASYIGSGDVVWCPLKSTNAIVATDFYHYRTWAEVFPKDPKHLVLRRPFAPEPGTVVVYCANHTEDKGDPRYNDRNNLRIGIYPFAREDMSVGMAKSSQIELWHYGDKGLTQENDPTKTAVLKFPGEPWPLTKE